MEKKFFEAKLALRVSWSQDKKNTSLFSVSSLDDSSYWNPGITITNFFGQMTTTSNLEVDVSSNAQPYFIETKFFHSTFFNTLDYHTYPFDIQRLSLMVQSPKPASELELLFEERSYISKGIYEAIKHKGLVLKEIYEMTMTPLSNKAVRLPQSRRNLKMTVFLKRKSFKSIIMNLIMFLLCLVSLSTLALDPILYQSGRVELSLMSSILIFIINSSSFNHFHTLISSTITLLNQQTKYYLLILHTSLSVCIFNSYGHTLISFFSSMPNTRHSADSTFPYIVASILGGALFYSYFSTFKLFWVWHKFDFEIKKEAYRDHLHLRF